MKMKSRLTSVGIFFLVNLLAISALAQTNAQPVNAGKIAVIYPSAFDDAKGGITKYVNALNTLEKEFQPFNSEMQTMKRNIKICRIKLKPCRSRSRLINFRSS